MNSIKHCKIKNNFLVYICVFRWKRSEKTILTYQIGNEVNFFENILNYLCLAFLSKFQVYSLNGFNYVQFKSHLMYKL